MHTVSDGRMATQVVAASGRAEVTAYRGSPAFIFDQLGGIDVRVVRDFLSGAPPPPGVRVRIVSDGPPARLVATTGLERLQLTIAAVHRPAAGDFRAARGHLSSRITLSGTAVTDASALFIARALRPL